MPIALRVGKDTVAVEDDGRHQALPSLPKSRIWSLAMSRTAER
jgi:hypothetical protein